MRPVPGTVQQFLIKASDIFVVRISPGDVEAEAGRVENITYVSVIRRGHCIKLRAGDGIERVEIADRKEVDTLICRIAIRVHACITEESLPRLRGQDPAIAGGLEIFAEALVGEEEEALVASVIFRNQNRATNIESEEVLSQDGLVYFRSVVEEVVGIQRVVAMLIEKPAMKGIAAGFGDHADLRHATSGIRADRSDRHAEFTRAIQRRLADGNERTGLDEVVHGINAVLGHVGSAATESANRSIAGIITRHGDSSL